MEPILCRFCEFNGETTPATKLAPQDEQIEHPHFAKAKFMWRWSPVCDEHFKNWYSIHGRGRAHEHPPYFELNRGTSVES